MGKIWALLIGSISRSQPMKYVQTSHVIARRSEAAARLALKV